MISEGGLRALWELELFLGIGPSCELSTRVMSEGVEDESNKDRVELPSYNVIFDKRTNRIHYVPMGK